MVQTPIQATPTQRLVARLSAEGWVDCPGLEFPALSQHPMPDLRQFVLSQLCFANGWMTEVDLQLAALIFAIPAHEFRFHPGLPAVLQQLAAAELIVIQEMPESGKYGRKRHRAIALATTTQNLRNQ